MTGVVDAGRTPRRRSILSRLASLSFISGVLTVINGTLLPT